MPFIPSTEENRKQMLNAIGVSDFEELLKDIPDNVRFKGDLDLPRPLSEIEVTNLLEKLAAKNKHTGTHACFLGAGAYDHFIPAAVDHVISRPEFYTAYTPYQPEVSQGNLQAIYEYQTMIANLTDMDVANASLYDGASALAEAALLSANYTRKEDILISKSVHPFYREVVETYCNRSEINLKEINISDYRTDIDQLKNLTNENTAGLLVQSPNFFGFLENLREMEKIIHEVKGLYTISVDPISLGILKPPGKYNADIVTGEGQALGNHLSLGGPYLGIFAAKKSLIRKMPGRIAAVTEDKDGRRGFVLTLQTREQHIRRDKATSSICTNQQLCALAATVYMALMGKKGIPAVANLCVHKAHYLAEKLAEIKGVELLEKHPFFKEFALKTPVKANKIINQMRKKNIFAGIDLSRFDYDLENALLIAVTEKRTKEEMDRYVEVMKEIIQE
ncbi:MAG: aminomethyl-transferring glycine dehydrogenase subunit GcvPA [bacterium]